MVLFVCCSGKDIMVNVRREYKGLKIEDKRNKGIRFVFLLYFDNEGNVYFY